MMHVSVEIILLNLYYTGVAIALLIRDILWLRMVLLISGTLLVTYGTLTGNRTVVVWNLLFVFINTVHIIILAEKRKPVKISDDLLPVYHRVFHSMRRRDFMTLMKKGHVVSGDKKVLCRKGCPQENLYLIIDGEAEVIKNGKTVARLGCGDFIAELSFFTGNAASADVISMDTIRYVFWNQATIRRISRQYPEMYEKLYQIMNRDISMKLSRSGVQA
ncbi:MAG: cyclic nucleotide-binding domain-containing protein [Spirochaetota bacterium]